MWPINISGTKMAVQSKESRRVPREKSPGGSPKRRKEMDLMWRTREAIKREPTFFWGGGAVWGTIFHQGQRLQPALKQQREERREGLRVERATKRPTPKGGGKKRKGREYNG